jgi:hypothetical protein
LDKFLKILREPATWPAPPQQFRVRNLAAGSVVVGPAHFTRIDPPMLFPDKSWRTHRKSVAPPTAAARRAINAASGRESLTAED